MQQRLAGAIGSGATVNQAGTGNLGLGVIHAEIAGDGVIIEIELQAFRYLTG